MENEKQPGPPINQVHITTSSKGTGSDERSVVVGARTPWLVGSFLFGILVCAAFVVPAGVNASRVVRANEQLIRGLEAEVHRRDGVIRELVDAVKRDADRISQARGIVGSVGEGISAAAASATNVGEIFLAIYTALDELETLYRVLGGYELRAEGEANAR